jgi:hypothetical protein
MRLRGAEFANRRGEWEALCRAVAAVAAHDTTTTDGEPPSRSPTPSRTFLRAARRESPESRGEGSGPGLVCARGIGARGERRAGWGWLGRAACGHQSTRHARSLGVVLWGAGRRTSAHSPRLGSRGLCCRVRVSRAHGTLGGFYTLARDPNRLRCTNSLRRRRIVRVGRTGNAHSAAWRTGMCIPAGSGGGNRSRPLRALAALDRTLV